MAEVKQLLEQHRMETARVPHMSNDLNSRIAILAIPFGYLGMLIMDTDPLGRPLLSLLITLGSIYYLLVIYFATTLFRTAILGLLPLIFYCAFGFISGLEGTPGKTPQSHQNNEISSPQESLNRQDHAPYRDSSKLQQADIDFKKDKNDTETYEQTTSTLKEPVEVPQKKQNLPKPVQLSSPTPSASHPVNVLRKQQNVPKPVQLSSPTPTASHPVNVLRKQQNVPKPVSSMGN